MRTGNGWSNPIGEDESQVIGSRWSLIGDHNTGRIDYVEIQIGEGFLVEMSRECVVEAMRTIKKWEEEEYLRGVYCNARHPY